MEVILLRAIVSEKRCTVYLEKCCTVPQSQSGEYSLFLFSYHIEGCFLYKRFACKNKRVLNLTAKWLFGDYGLY